MSSVIAAFLVSMSVGLAIAPLFIYLMKKVKAKQRILSYVTQHKEKDGVPTMGGVVFILSATVGFFLFRSERSTLATVAYAAFVSYGLIGLLDDGIKVFFKRNLGLRAYQKIISQAVVALLLTYFCYTNEYIGSEIYIPFTGQTKIISYWCIPLCLTIFLATTNAVNLTDGLDGLAGSVCAIYLFFIGVFIWKFIVSKEDVGSVLWAQEGWSVLVLCAAVVGGIASFLWFNTNRARIFMGDTGSLALGGICAILPVLIKNPFLIAFVGITFVVSVISVIVQVIVFKWKKKRVFLMAPLHHHLEMKGYKEPAVVSFYSLITVFFGAVALLFW